MAKAPPDLLTRITQTFQEYRAFVHQHGEITDTVTMEWRRLELKAANVIIEATEATSQ